MPQSSSAKATYSVVKNLATIADGARTLFDQTLIPSLA